MSDMLQVQEPGREYASSLRVITVVVSCAFCLLFGRMWYLQILKGNTFRNYADTNRLKQVVNRAPRGIIFDRNSKVLVDNTIDFDVNVAYQFLRDETVLTETLGKLKKLLSLSDDDIKSTRERIKQGKNFEPVKVKKQISRDELAFVETQRDDLPGVDVSIESKRTYLYKEIGGQIYGYIGEISKDELENMIRKNSRKYRMGDYTGKSGIEKAWEDYLKGEDGVNYVEVDALGRRLDGRKDTFLFPKLPPKTPSPGNNLHLTLDADLQVAAYQAMKEHNGAVVALEPKTGQVLSMISKPGFDPTLFSRGIETKTFADLTNNPLRPFRNKAVQDHFPPGSTFKTITAIAGLESGLITEDTTVYCRGSFAFGNRPFHCWKKEGHGPVNLHTAIMKSCDIFFYQLATKLPIDTLYKYATMLGLGRPTDIHLDHEARGLIPSEKWKKDTFNAPWYPGETLSVVVGQGSVSVTPLQLALAYASLTNGGALYQPYIVSRVEDSRGNVLFSSEPRLIQGTELKPQTVAAIVSALTSVVEDTGGTGHAQKSKLTRMAGKSGTSQVISISKDKIYRKCDGMNYFQRHHGWFVAMAPPENAEIVVAVFAEHGCSGSGAAAPVARAVIDAFFQKKMGPPPADMKISAVSPEAVKALGQVIQ